MGLAFLEIEAANRKRQDNFQKIFKLGGVWSKWIVQREVGDLTGMMKSLCT